MNNEKRTEDITSEEIKIWTLKEKVSKRLYNQTKENLKNTKLEELTEEDIFILYLSQQTNLEDLEKPEIQQLLIKHEFISSLLNEIDYIDDKQVIKDLLSSKDFAESKYIIKPITITDTEFKEVDETLDDQFIIFHFIDKETQKSYSLEPVIPLEPSNAEEYKDKIMSNKDNMLVILDSTKDEPVTLVKYYEDIQ